MTHSSNTPDVQDQATPPLGNWLNKWRLNTTSPAKLFPNARQQVEVTVTLEPRTNTTITDAEMASLKLLVRQDDGRFADVPMQDDGSRRWFGSEQMNDYEYYPETFTITPVIEDGGPLPGAIRAKRFYLHARARAGSQQEFWASITRNGSDGERYEYISDGSQTGFNSSVTLATVNAPTYNAPADYTFERRLVSGEENSDLFVWEYALAPAHAQYPEVVFLSARADPQGMIQWATKQVTQTRASHVGFAVPGSRAIQYNSAIVLGPNFVRVKQTSTTHAGSVAVVLQGGNNIPFHTDSALQHKGPIVIWAIDHYGNEHQVKAKFESELPPGRTALVLFKV